MTWTMRACAARSASISDTMGRVKSTTACASAIRGRGSAVSLMPLGCQPGQLAGVQPQIGMAFQLPARRDKRDAGALRDLAHQGAAHAAGRAGDDDVQVRHAPLYRPWYRRRRLARRFASRNRHHGGTQQPVADHVAGLHHIHDAAGGLAVAGHFGDGLVQIGIELAVLVSTAFTP